MSARPWKERLGDMLDVIGEIRSFVEGMSFEQFEADPKTRKAVAADFAILGEAAGNVPAAVAERTPRSRGP